MSLQSITTLTFIEKTTLIFIQEYEGPCHCGCNLPFVCVKTERIIREIIYEEEAEKKIHSIIKQLSMPLPLSDSVHEPLPESVHEPPPKTRKRKNEVNPLLKRELRNNSDAEKIPLEYYTCTTCNTNCYHGKRCKCKKLKS